MTTIYHPTQELPDVVEFFCEACCCSQPHYVRDVGDFEYYRCKVCGYQRSYRVR